MANENPYDVRNIVEQYIHDKLLKKGFKWESCAGFNDGSHPSNRHGDHLPSSSSSSSSGSDSVRQRSHILPTSPPTNPEEGPAGPSDTFPQQHARLHSVLREAGDEIERMYQRHFVEMSGQLHFTPSTARRRFIGVVEELFRGGVNWGRIVAFFEFGGTMCVESVNREMTSQVDNIVCWMTEYLNAPPLQPWIEENGGWDAFVALYGARQRGSLVFSWPSLKTVFGLAALGAAGVTIGALFSQK
ncbi:apoptosis regulator Bcl-2-like [Aplochiton taeniatus]